MSSSREQHQPDLRGHTVVALHAHPDDEAIFTGITLRRLADAGARTVLVMATAGELGESRVGLRPGESVAARRLAELERAAGLLGVARLVLLDHRDSGLPGWPSTSHARALAAADPVTLGRRIAELLDEEGADTLIHDDEHGIYGHPDHRATHRAGSIAATLAGVAGYQMTIDREHLHVTAPGLHLVQGAAQAAAVGFGRVTAEIGLAITGTPDQLDCKRAAITAHASQIDPDDVPVADFSATYGYEWYRRTPRTPVPDRTRRTEPEAVAPRSGGAAASAWLGAGGFAAPAGVLEQLGNSHLLAGAGAGRSARTGAPAGPCAEGP